MSNPDPINDQEHAQQRQQTIFLYRMQWIFNIASIVLTSIAIGLNFAGLIGLAQIFLILIAVAVLGSFGLAGYRFYRNQKRREEIIERMESQLGKEYEGQLRSYFNGVKMEKGMHPTADNSLFDATLREIEEKTKIEEARQLGKPYPVSRPPKSNQKKGGSK